MKTVYYLTDINRPYNIMFQIARVTSVFIKITHKKKQNELYSINYVHIHMHIENTIREFILRQSINVQFSSLLFIWYRYCIENKQINAFFMNKISIDSSHQFKETVFHKSASV